MGSEREDGLHGITLVEVLKTDDGSVLGVASTRSDLERMLGRSISSRNEHGGWSVADADGQDSLSGIDEVASGLGTGFTLRVRFKF